MNCKQGDLAVIIHKASPNYGRFVTVARPASSDECARLGFSGEQSPSWFVEAIGAPLIVATGKAKGLHHTRPFADSSLRPIRPQSDDAVDTHSLRLPAPQKEQA